MSELIARLLEGDPLAVARAISIVESDAEAAARLITELHAHAGRAYCVGITGPPGAGKSTLVNRVVAAMRRRGRRVGVLAVDPSSPFTSGAILGDRVRMQDHAADAGVFVRSMATRGHLGGVAAATADAAVVLDAAGFDVVIVETVGVGQDEVDIVRLADVSVVTLVPGAGDDVQTLKAGLMEIADVFVVNKADLGGADRVAEALAAMLSLDEAVPDDPDETWRPQILQVSAATGAGVEELIDVLDRFRVVGDLASRRRQRAEWRAPLAADRHPRMWLDHVAIATTEAGAIAALLRDVLDLPVSPAETVADQGVRVTFAGSGRPRIEVVSPYRQGSAVDAFLARRGPGLHHIAFEVADLEAELTRLKARGIRLIDEHPRPGAHGTRIAFLHPSSTCGVLIELLDRTGTDAAR